MTMLLKKTTLTEKYISKIYFKYVIFDYYMRGFGLLAWSSSGQHSYGILPGIGW